MPDNAPMSNQLHTVRRDKITGNLEVIRHEHVYLSYIIGRKVTVSSDGASAPHQGCVYTRPEGDSVEITGLREKVADRMRHFRLSLHDATEQVFALELEACGR